MTGTSYIYSLVLFINLVLQAVLAAVALAKNPRRVFNQVLFMAVAASWLWCLTFFVRYGLFARILCPGEAEFLRWAKISHVAGVLGFAYSTYFFFIFPDRPARPVSAALTVTHLGLAPAVLIALIVFGEVVGGARLVQGILLLEPGPQHWVWALFALVSVLVGVGALARKYRHLVGLQRLQVQYVLLGISASMVVGLVTNVMIPGLTRVLPDLAPLGKAALFGPVAVIFYVAATAVAVVKHRLLEIELVVVRSLAYLAASLVLVVLYVGLVMFSEHHLRVYLGETFRVSSLIGAFAVALLFSPLRGRIQRGCYELLFASTFEYQTALRESAQAIVTKLDLHDMAEFLVQSIRKHLGTPRVGLLVRSEEGGPASFELAAHLGTREGAPEVCDLTPQILSWLEQEKVPLVRDELENRRLELRDSELVLDHLSAAVLVPILIEERLEGVIGLDRKTNGRSFSPTDIELLTMLAAQAAVAIMNARLYDQAITDKLTGCFNRRYFDQRLMEEVNRSRRYARALSLVMIDIDHFKVLNDTHGHQCGDEVLGQLARVVREAVRESDVVCRYGGEEIAVILPEAGQAGGGPSVGQMVGERIRANVAAQPVRWKGTDVAVTVSVGATDLPEGQPWSQTPADLVRLADDALYRAKRAGRNRVVLARGESGDQHPTLAGGA